jgi:hypothetical protein
MITKLNKVWRNALVLCAVTVVAVLVSSCCAPASDAGRYQWNIVPGESDSAKIYVIDTGTGEIAEWNRREKTWDLSYAAPLSIPDWNVIRERRVWLEKREKKEREQLDALVKSYSQMPLEKQVAWADTIKIITREAKSRNFKVETLKGCSIVSTKWPYTATGEGMVVWFYGSVKGGSMPLKFGLANPPTDSEGVFPAPATIIDDVKAEIKRQEEQKK